jgi:5-methylcytosine-specific restriction enzyme subunit McrC
MLVNLCNFIIKGMLLTTETGDYRLSEWIGNEQMYTLYQKFVLAYYKKEKPKYSPKASYIDWDLTDGAEKSFLPAMISDITLSNGDKTLIIDTKWYEKGIMQMHDLYDSTTFKSRDLYQIFTYVKNKDKGVTGNVAGVLLYAKTDELITPDHDFYIGGSQISLKTLDLSGDWNAITVQLDRLCSWLEIEQAA